LQSTPVLILGAGPAGLALAARLRRLGIDFELLEKSDRVGSAWHGHYERLRLHTVKEMSHLPHLEFPDDYPRYVSRRQMCDYFDRYAEKFDIKPHFGEAAAEVRRLDDGRWFVRTSSGAEWAAEQVVVATGVNRAPHRPRFPGEERFRGAILHSRDYRRPAPFAGKKVLVIGMGNTGAEIALDLAENGAEPYLSVRSPVAIVPRDFLGRPTQRTALLLARLPHWLGDRISALVQRLSMGDLPRYGLPLSDIPPGRHLRELGRTPVVDIGAAQAIREGRIRVLPDVDRFDETGAVFADGQRLDIDAVILATGYRAALDEFLPDAEDLLDEHGAPKEMAPSGRYKGLYFLGFDTQTAGGILGVINRDSKRIAGLIAKEVGR
jgi:cation diffusion facilitator CzcD-associated flavoprotein CzcO